MKSAHRFVNSAVVAYKTMCCFDERRDSTYRILALVLTSTDHKPCGIIEYRKILHLSYVSAMSVFRYASALEADRGLCMQDQLDGNHFVRGLIVGNIRISGIHSSKKHRPFCGKKITPWCYSHAYSILHRMRYSREYNEFIIKNPVYPESVSNLIYFSILCKTYKRHF